MLHRRVDMLLLQSVGGKPCSGITQPQCVQFDAM